ncbi:MAG TPA: glycosyltransferase family 4 protein [Aggregatilineaceae bacterium]|nr:glycosyltransferase family 4 protein [Aggregatilineaceae bacterium]
MRIFVATGIFHPEPGGPATYLYHILPAIQAYGHEVHLLTFGDAPIAGYPYPVRRVPRRFSPRRMADYARAAWPEIRRADLVFIHSLGLPLIGANRKPRVVKVVGDLAWERAVNKGWIPPTTDIDEFQQRRYAWRVRLVQSQRAREVQQMDHIIVPSQYLRTMVIGWGAPPQHVQVIYNSISPQHRTSSLSRDEARQQLGLDDAPLLLYSGRLTAWKGVDHVIRALRQVPNVRLLIAGDGPEEGALQALAKSINIADRIHFLRRVSRDQLAIYYRAADYTILYSGYEGLSHVLLESLMAGTPVIASDKGGNPEVVRHGENGLLVPYVALDALIATIQAAIASDQQARLAAQTGNGLERFAWNTMVEQTVAALEGVCGC